MSDEQTSETPNLNEIPKLRVRSREVSEEDKKQARAFEEQSAFEHTVNEASEDVPTLKTLQPKDETTNHLDAPSPALDPEATLVVPHQAMGASGEKTTFIPHDQKDKFMNVSALEPEDKLPSDLSVEPKPNKSPLKLARPTMQQQQANAHIPSTFQDSESLPKLDESTEEPKVHTQQQEDLSFQENLFTKLEVTDGKLPNHIKFTSLALAGVLIIVSTLMGFISFIPAAILGFCFSLASAKMANQQFFIKGLGAMIGRLIYTAIFLGFALLTISQFSSARQKLAPFIEQQTEAFLDKLENFDDIENENAKSFYVLLRGNESSTNAKILEFNQKLAANTKSLEKKISPFGIQLFLLTIAFLLLGLAQCKFCFAGAPLALSSKSSTVSIVTLSRCIKATLAYFLALIGLSFTGVENAGFISASLFIITLISPFSMLALFSAAFTLYLCQGLSDNQSIVFIILFIIFLLMELNFKLFMKPFAGLKRFIPEEFFKSEVQGVGEALLGSLQMLTQVTILAACAGIGFLGYSIFEIKKAIDKNEAIYVEAEHNFADNGPIEEVKTAFGKGLYQREGDRRWLMLKLKYFIAKEQFPTALDVAEAFKDGEDYPALNPNHTLVKFLNKNFKNEFGDVEESHDEKAFAILLNNRKFSKQKSYIEFAEQYLADNPESLVAYLATARYYIQHRPVDRLKVNLKSIYEAMSELNNEAIETKLISGFHFFYQKEYEKAISAFTAVIEKDSPLYNSEAKLWLKKAEETGQKAFFGET